MRLWNACLFNHKDSFITIVSWPVICMARFVCLGPTTCEKNDGEQARTRMYIMWCFWVVVKGPTGPQSYYHRALFPPLSLC